MAIRVANGPVSWGVDMPDTPNAPPWQTVFSEIADAGYHWCELGPLGYLIAFVNSVWIILSIWRATRD